jgi:hypothetical protein
VDLHVYCVEFDDGDVSELTANVIAELMYALWDDEGNKYLMMDLSVNHSVGGDVDIVAGIAKLGEQEVGNTKLE